MSTTSSLELAVLGLLKEGAMHGYELSKRLRFTLGPLYTVSYGSLYPCLKRLGLSGMVRERTGEAAELKPKPRLRKAIVPDARANRGSTKRARKVYEITSEGEAFFFEQLEQGAVYDTDRFQTRFAFFRYLPKEMRIRLLEHRKAYLEEKLADFNDTLRATRERMDAYSRSLIDHSVETTQTDIRWLQGLIDEERRAAPDDPAPGEIESVRRATHDGPAASEIKKERRATHDGALPSEVKKERRTARDATSGDTKKVRRAGTGDVRAKRGGKH
jgi:DNA-binding PadR family transcriptional regulator